MQRPLRFGGVSADRGFDPLQRTGGDDGLLDLRDLLRRECGVADESVERGTRVAGQSLSGVGDEERALALTQIVTRRLPGDSTVAEHAEHIVA